MAKAAQTRKSSPDWMREFQAPTTPPSSDSDRTADPYALDDTAAELPANLSPVQEAGVKNSRHLNPDPVGREINLKGTSYQSAEGLPSEALGGSREGGPFSGSKESKDRRGEDGDMSGGAVAATADINGKQQGGRKGTGGKGAEVRGKESQAAGGESGEGGGWKSAGKGAGRKPAVRKGRAEGSEEATGTKGAEEGGHTKSGGGVINLDSDDEPPPLATQQSAALAEKPRRARKPASTAADETPSKPSGAKSRTANSLNGQTGEADSRGLFDSQPEGILKTATKGQDAELDPYALPTETVKEAARRLTLSPAARLGLSPLKGAKSADAGSGLYGVNTSQGEPSGGDKSGKQSAEGRKASGSKKQGEGVAGGRKRQGAEETDVEIEEEERKVRDEADVGGSSGFGRGERSARKRAKPSYREESASEDEEMDEIDRGEGASQFPEKRRRVQDGEGEERQKQKRAKPPSNEEVGSRDGETIGKEDGALSLSEKKRRGKAKAEEELDTDETATADENKVQKRRKSGGLVLDEEGGAGVEKKVVSPTKRRKSGALAEESVLNELRTQATVATTQEVGPERKGKPRAAAMLPLVMPDKVHRTKVLVECEGEGKGENALDLSGDVGAVGRFSVLKKPGGDGEKLLLDLKGVMYRATIVPSTTYMVVNLGPTEAKVESIMNDFVQLREETNVFQTETTIEGTLDDFDFGEGAEDERPGKSTGQEVGAAEGAGPGEGAPGTKRKKTATKDGEAKPKKKSAVAPKKKPVKAGGKAKAKPKARVKPRKQAKAQAEKPKKSRKS